jgi:hypothetical protein
MGKKIHGMTKHGYAPRIYRIWAGMKDRCYNKNRSKYKRYGARGIVVCEEWKNNFMNFYNWAISNGYQDNLSIDRKDNDGNYEPDNCRWITNKEQCNNTSINRFITINNKTQTLSQWAREVNIRIETIEARLKKGLEGEDLIKKPIKNLIAINGESKTITEWSRISGINSRTIASRINSGWNIQDILNPVKRDKK